MAVVITAIVALLFFSSVIYTGNLIEINTVLLQMLQLFLVTLYIFFYLFFIKTYIQQ